MCEGPTKRVNSKHSKSWIATPQTDQAMGSPKKGSGRKHGLMSPAILTWRPAQAWRIARAHPLLVLMAISFVAVIPFEYTVKMVAPGQEPFDAGFVLTESLYQLLKQRPTLNHVLAAANTVLVVFQIAYIAWVFAVEGRFRPTLASLFMYSSRGLLGYSTQLPVPQDFLGSKVDFPVGDASFFLFFSGHVGASLITALDLRRVNRMRGAFLIDTLNVLQTVRLLATRGHYTIDLAGGAVAGWGCYYLAELYEERMKPAVMASTRVAPQGEHSNNIDATTE
ncbi:hypothetical protein KC19_12G108200 [Ceratodon purpureus]|uniref:AtPDCT1/2 transmembrane domain-containing protein n=1 Tax=Ceratodon purpureus TaxID=3225 RepID=A0A8T0G6V0_CERPU|nr:hypothetical protein KC19_12G108200 [Ceratodon purpureus]